MMLANHSSSVRSGMTQGFGDSSFTSVARQMISSTRRFGAAGALAANQYWLSIRSRMRFTQVGMNQGLNDV